MVADAKMQSVQHALTSIDFRGGTLYNDRQKRGLRWVILPYTFGCYYSHRFIAEDPSRQADRSIIN